MGFPSKASGRRVLGVPMPRHIDTSTEPYVRVPLHMIEETLQRGETPGASYNPAVQTDAHHSRSLRPSAYMTSKVSTR